MYLWEPNKSKLEQIKEKRNSIATTSEMKVINSFERTVTTTTYSTKRASSSGSLSSTFKVPSTGPIFPLTSKATDGANNNSFKIKSESALTEVDAKPFLNPSYGRSIPSITPSESKPSYSPSYSRLPPTKTTTTAFPFTGVRGPLGTNYAYSLPSRNPHQISPRPTAANIFSPVPSPTKPKIVPSLNPVYKSSSNPAWKPTLVGSSSLYNCKDLEQRLDIKVKKSSTFYDQLSKVPTYNTRSKKRGYLLLINNIKFADPKMARKGAEVDEKNIISLFTQMGFKCEKHRDKNKKDMELCIKQFRSNKSLKSIDICVVVIMSHGTGKERSDSTEIVTIDDQLIPTTWITNEFNNEICPYLSGKPKIFIFQCCRGDKKDDNKIVHDRFTSPPRQAADMLMAYSTAPGFVSHRDLEMGTWYVQAICKIFMEHAHDTHVEDLLKMVDSKLATLMTGQGSKQTASFENRGFKNCYLHPMHYG